MDIFRCSIWTLLIFPESILRHLQSSICNRTYYSKVLSIQTQWCKSLNCWTHNVKIIYVLPMLAWALMSFKFKQEKKCLDFSVLCPNSAEKWHLIICYAKPSPVDHAQLCHMSVRMQIATSSANWEYNDRCGKQTHNVCFTALQQIVIKGGPW